MQKTIIVAGATGNLGTKIVDELLKNNAIVIAIVRSSSDKNKVAALKTKGVQIHVADTTNAKDVATYCKGAHCMVSALAGLRSTTIDAQTIFAEAAVIAGIPRFIASDFCSDYRNLIPGNNRNLDDRRDFAAIVDKLNIKTTGIFNGAFMELLTAEMPLILYKQNKILCWGNANQKMEFTHTLNIAAYTAQIALAEQSPRYLSIAGDVLNCNDFVNVLSKLSNKTYKIFKPGGIGLFNVLIKITRFFVSGKQELYPPWQGMQYLRDMMEGRIKIEQHHNNLANVQWQTAEQYLQVNATDKL